MNWLEDVIAALVLVAVALWLGMIAIDWRNHDAGKHQHVLEVGK